MTEAVATGGRRLFFQLLGWRLRFYAEATFKLLIRRWQISCFALFILSPADMPFSAQLQGLSKPVQYLLDGDDAMPIWLALCALAAAWSSTQAETLRGGAPWLYLKTLPHIAPLEKKLDLWLLLIADLPLLLPFAAFILSRQYADIQSYSVDSLLAVALAAQLPVIQQLILRGSLPAASWVFSVSLFALWIQNFGDYDALFAVLLAAGPVSAVQLQKIRCSRLSAFKTVTPRRFGRLLAHRHPLANLALSQYSGLAATP